MKVSFLLHPDKETVTISVSKSESVEERVEERNWIQSLQDQELRVDVDGHQLIFKMSSEYQTVDHTNKIMGNDHETIFVHFVPFPTV